MRSVFDSLINCPCCWDLPLANLFFFFFDFLLAFEASLLLEEMSSVPSSGIFSMLLVMGELFTWSS